MSQSVNCPFCNAIVPVPIHAQTGQRIPCPRCEESFPLPQLDEQFTSSSPSEPPRSASNRFANWKIALLVVGVMVILAGGALAYMLLSEDQRRNNDKGIDKNRGRFRVPGISKPPEKVQAKAPLELQALRYFPRDTQIVLGVHVAELLQVPEGQQLLSKGLEVAGQRLELTRLEGLLSISFKELEHLVLGVRAIEKELLPPLHLVIHGKRAFDQTKIIEKLRAKKLAGSATPAVYHFTLEVLPTHVDGRLSFPNATTMVLGWNVGKDASVMRLQSAEGQTKLSESMTSVLKEYIQPPSPIWAVAHHQNWKEALKLVLGAIKMDEEDVELLTKFRTLALWVQKDEGIVVRGVVRATDEDAAKALQKELPRLPEEIHSNLRVVQNKEWLQLQYRPKK